MDRHKPAQVAQSNILPPTDGPFLPRYWRGRFVPCPSNDIDTTADYRVVPHQLCTKCENLRQHLRAAVSSPDHYRSASYFTSFDNHCGTISRLDRSARAGCHLCSLLLDRAQDIYRGEKSNLYEVGEIDYNLGISIAKKGSLMMKISYPGCPTFSTVRDVVTTQVNAFNKASANKMISSSSTMSTLTRGWALEKHKFCVANHPECRLPYPYAHSLPTRLLQIQNEGLVRIVHSVDLNPKPTKYIALSYCWGQQKSVLLTKDSTDKLLSGVSMECLPKTIRDAINISSWYGVNYVWVDSLCIVQDDPQDWMREGLNMSSVYFNAHLTIGALGSEHRGQGCFATRNPLMHQPCHLFDNDSNQSIFAIPYEPHVTMAHKFQGSPLCRRGWTLQERLISRRTLYFGDILYYECCKETISELGWSKNNNVQYSNIKKLLPSKLKQAGIPDATFALTNCSQPSISREFQGSEILWWDKIVETYTLGKLTVKNDRLIAITGIIDSIENRTGCKNIAGFWEPLTGNSLVWTAMKKGFTNNRAPSWSWLSVDTPVKWPLFSPGIQSICSIMITRSNNFIADRSGLGVKLSIRGPFFRISSIKPSFPEQDPPYSNTYDLRGDAYHHVDYCHIHWDHKLKEGGKFHSHVIDLSKPLYYFACTHHVRPSGSVIRTGLILTSFIPRSKVYQRIGSFNWNPPERYQYHREPESTITLI